MAQGKSAARKLFEKIRHTGGKWADQAVSNQMEESLLLEFKVQEDRSTGTLSRKDRESLAQSISGFSNTEGGVIVWGIHSKRLAGGIDCAQSTPAIREPRTFLQDLNSQCGQVTDPAVAGVENVALKGRNGSGYVATYVPGSERLVFSLLADVRGPWARSGSSFYAMPRRDIEARILSATRPDLVLSVTIGNTMPPTAIIGVRNRGIAVGKYVQVRLKVEPPFSFAYYGLDGNGNDGMEKRPSDRVSSYTEWYARPGDVILRGGTIPVTRMEVSKSYVGSITSSQPGLRFWFWLAAENMGPIEGNVVIFGQPLIHPDPSQVYLFKDGGGQVK